MKQKTTDRQINLIKIEIIERIGKNNSNRFGNNRNNNYNHNGNNRFGKRPLDEKGIEKNIKKYNVCRNCRKRACKRI